MTKGSPKISQISKDITVTLTRGTNATATVGLIVGAWIVIQLLGDASFAFKSGVDDGSMDELGGPNVKDIRRINMAVGIILFILWMFAAGMWIKIGQITDKIPLVGAFMNKILPGVNTSKFGRSRR